MRRYIFAFKFQLKTILLANSRAIFTTCKVVLVIFFFFGGSEHVFLRTVYRMRWFIVIFKFKFIIPYKLIQRSGPLTIRSATLLNTQTQYCMRYAPLDAHLKCKFAYFGFFFYFNTKNIRFLIQYKHFFNDTISMSQTLFA